MYAQLVTPLRAKIEHHHYTCEAGGQPTLSLSLEVSTPGLGGPATEIPFAARCCQALGQLGQDEPASG